MIESTDNIQVIGGGCGRTGTLSLKKALEIDKTEEEIVKENLEKEKEKLKTKQSSLNIVKSEQAKELQITKNQESNFKAELENRRKQKIAFEKEMFE